MSKIIRAKRESKSFALVDKNFINDKRLSYKAKGILVYILSKPDDWKVVIRDLINNAADGKASIYAGLKELERYGYYVKEPVRDEDGRRILDWTSIVWECRNCGHIVVGTKAPEVCPVCNHPQSYFEVRAENY